eukprot:364944-Chlamydomonas_euryale.AAC.18
MLADAAAAPRLLRWVAPRARAGAAGQACQQSAPRLAMRACTRAAAAAPAGVALRLGGHAQVAARSRVVGGRRRQLVRCTAKHRSRAAARTREAGVPHRGKHHRRRWRSVVADAHGGAAALAVADIVSSFAATAGAGVTAARHQRRARGHARLCRMADGCPGVPHRRARDAAQGGAPAERRALLFGRWRRPDRIAAAGRREGFECRVPEHAGSVEHVGQASVLVGLDVPSGPGAAGVPFVRNDGKHVLKFVMCVAGLLRVQQHLLKCLVQQALIQLYGRTGDSEGLVWEEMGLHGGAQRCMKAHRGAWRRMEGTKAHAHSVFRGEGSVQGCTKRFEGMSAGGVETKVL